MDDNENPLGASMLDGEDVEASVRESGAVGEDDDEENHVNDKTQQPPAVDVALDVEEMIDQIFNLAVDVTGMLMGWSCEGTEGLGDKVHRAVAAVRARLLKRMNKNATEDPFGELQLLIQAESAVITFGKNPNKRMAIINSTPGFPPFNALAAFKVWIHKLEEDEKAFSTFAECRTELQAIQKMRNPYPRWLQVLSVALLSMAFAIDVNPNWEAAIVALVFGVLGGFCYQATEWGPMWALFMAFIAAFLISFPIMLLFRYGVVEQSPGLLLVCPLFLFIPGDTITTQAIEIMTGYWSNGVARLFNALIQLVFLAFGAVLAAFVTGYDQRILDPGEGKDDFEWWAAYPNHVMFAVAAGWCFGLPAKDIPLDTVITLITTAVFQGFTKLISADFGTFLASVVMTILCIWAANSSIQRPPAFAYLASPFFTLTPGSMGMRGLDSLVSGDTIAGFEFIWDLFINLTVIAIGIIIGAIIAKKIFGLYWHKIAQK